MSSSKRCFLTCIQVSQETGKMVLYSHLFKNFPQFVVINIVKGCRVVNEAEVDVFLELPCFLHEPITVRNLMCGSSAFSKPSLYIWKFLIYILLKPTLKDFEHNITSMWNKHNCMVVWTFFLYFPSLVLEWKLTFSSPVATADFSKFAGILSAALSQHQLLGFEIAQLDLCHLHQLCL